MIVSLKLLIAKLTLILSAVHPAPTVPATPVVTTPPTTTAPVPTTAPTAEIGDAISIVTFDGLGGQVGVGGQAEASTPKPESEIDRRMLRCTTNQPGRTVVFNAMSISNTAQRLADGTCEVISNG